MPLYEYECRDCKNRFEIRQRIVEEPISVCPTCGGSCRRIIHPVGIVFKGSGFYVTDNRKGESTSSSSGSSSETKSESKAGESKASENKTSESKAADKSSTSSTTSDSKPATPAST